ncbi:MAG: AAA family ATPase [bacterium]|nr:AAA family ATPase [bacterium]
MKRKSGFHTALIAICGTHGSGKTILMTLLAQTLRKAGFNVAAIDETATNAPAYGFPINQETTPKAQMWILHKLFESLLHLEQPGIYHVIITDRWVDNAAYARLRFGNGGKPHVNAALSQLTVQPFDFVFIPKGRKDFLISNGTRAVDPRLTESAVKFQSEAEGEILRLFRWLKRRTKKLQRPFKFEVLPEFNDVQKRESAQLAHILKRIKPILKKRFPKITLPPL